MSDHSDSTASVGGENALETRLLGKRYGRMWALRDCSLTLPAGRMAALVGPNGAGKTTLLHLIVGLLAPDAGNVRVFGRAPYAQPLEVLPQVGFVAQDHPLYRGFTVNDMLTFGRRMNRQWDDAFAQTRLRQLGIPLDKRIGALSGGQQAQVALAVAIAKRPKLLLLDEPVASLDPLARRDFLRMLVEAARTRGITTLLSSHILADLEQSCDHLVILSAARVVLASDISTIIQTHRLLVGPSADTTGLADVRAHWRVIEERPASHQITLLAHSGETDSQRETLPAGWRSEEAPLEEITLAYLGQMGAIGDGVTPEPALQESQMEVSR